MSRAISLILDSILIKSCTSAGLFVFDKASSAEIFRTELETPGERVEWVERLKEAGI